MVCTVQKTKEVDRDLRGVYEALFGNRIADSTWRIIKTFLSEAQLELTPNNLQEYAALRKRYPKLSLTSLEFRALLIAVEKAKRLLPESITGEQFVRLLIAQEIRPDLSTIYRWFNQAGSRYNKSTIYSGNVIFAVIYRAVVWKFIDTRRSTKNG